MIDKVYKRKTLEMAWESVHDNRGSGGVDGQSLSGFAEQLEQQLNRLQSELQGDSYQPQPVRQVQIPKAGKPGEYRMLGIPTIYDVVGSRPIVVSGDSLTVTMRVGIALSSEFAESDVDKIINQADKALYAAKAGGRNCVRMSKSNAEKAPALEEPIAKEPELLSR